MSSYVITDDDYLAKAELDGAGIDADSVIVVQRHCADCPYAGERVCCGQVSRMLPVGGKRKKLQTGSIDRKAQAVVMQGQGYSLGHIAQALGITIRATQKYLGAK